MSLLADRQAIAAALNTVDGIRAYDDPPEYLQTPGDGYARWTGMEAQGALLIFRVSWEVVIVAGRTQGVALQFLDDHLTAILDALDQLVYITGTRPGVIETPNGDLYGVVITGEKES